MSNCFKERPETQRCYNSVSHGFFAKHRGVFV